MDSSTFRSSGWFSLIELPDIVHLFHSVPVPLPWTRSLQACKVSMALGLARRVNTSRSQYQYSQHRLPARNRRLANAPRTTSVHDSSACIFAELLCTNLGASPRPAVRVSACRDPEGAPADKQDCFMDDGCRSPGSCKTLSPPGPSIVAARAVTGQDARRDRPGRVASQAGTRGVTGQDACRDRRVP